MSLYNETHLRRRTFADTCSVFLQLVFSTLYEVLVDFTRDYDAIRTALTKIEHYDKTCLENMLHAVKNILISNWGSQNQSQVIVFTDCGIGFGQTSIRTTIASLRSGKSDAIQTSMCLPFTFNSKLSFVCIAQPEEAYVRQAISLYQELLDVSGQNGELFVSKPSQGKEKPMILGDEMIRDLVNRLCEANYKPFSAVLKCGAYAKLECGVSIWPKPMVS